MDELDRLTSRKPTWTTTAQIVPTLYDFGLDVKYFSRSDIEPFLGGERYIREHFGSDAEKILKMTRRGGDGRLDEEADGIPHISRRDCSALMK